MGFEKLSLTSILGDLDAFCRQPSTDQPLGSTMGGDQREMLSQNADEE